MLKKIKGLRHAVHRKKEGAGDYLVALDIGTEFVKALIGKIEGDTVEIIGVGRAHQELSDMHAGAIADIGAVVANCDKALSQAEQQAGVSARTAVIGIAGELVKGTTTRVRLSRKNPDRPLDAAELTRSIKMVQERAEQRARQELAWELGGKEIQIRLVNSALVDIVIDGYTVTNPVGFQGKDVVIQLYTAFAPLVHIGALEQTAQHLDLDLLSVAAEPFAVARSFLGNDANSTSSAILMDVGGGTTDIAIINDGGVQGTKMFGIGGRAFTRGIERHAGTTFARAEELKLALGTGKLPQHTISGVEKALSKTLGVWMSGVELALGEFQKLDHLPNKILLCGGGSSLEMLVDRMERSDWYKKLPFTKKPAIQHIQPGQVAGIIDTTGAVVDHTFITAMGLLRVGHDTLHASAGQDAGSIKARLDRMLRV